MSELRIAVVGATGVVGSSMLARLAERDFPASKIVPLASARSAGKLVEFGDQRLEVQDIATASTENFDIALFSAGSTVSSEWGPKFAQAGAVVIDNSSYWRMHDDVLLVVPEVNGHVLDRIGQDNISRIVANPNCSTAQMVMALKPIHDAVGLDRIVVSTYQSVSGTGQAAVQELRDQSAALLADPHKTITPAVYPHQIAFNVIPQVETFKDGDDYTTEERKMMAETRKLLELPDLRISATCARVPVVTGHSESVNIQTHDPISPQQCRDVISAFPGVTIIDDPADGLYPTAIDGAGRDEVLVGRIRTDESASNSLNLWIVGDNLRKGAATNAVQVAEALIERGVVS